jgi:hypothetical protein
VRKKVTHSTRELLLALGEGKEEFTGKYSSGFAFSALDILSAGF